MLFPSFLALAAPLTYDQAVEDTWELATILETSHPDPFLRGGGRVAFYRALDEQIRALPAEGIEPEVLRDHLAPLVARVGDGHTSLARSSAPARPLGLGLTALRETLVVTEVGRPADVELLGARVISVGGVSVDELLARQDLVAGSDNLMHRRARVAHALSSGVGREALLGDPEPGPVRLLTASGQTLTYTPVEATEPTRAASAWSLPAPGPHDMAWTLLDDHTAYLRIASMMRYREAFESWRTAGFESNLGDYLNQVAGDAHKKLARDRDGRILQVPSATETFSDLFRAMDRKGADTLIVDLRGNQGGNSALSLVFGSFLAQPDELARRLIDDDGYQIRRFSPLFHEAHANAQRPEGVPDGGYDFRPLHEDPAPPEEGVAHLLRYVQSMPTLAAALDAGPLHVPSRPQLKVLVDANTYSAGFDLVRLLDGMGAELIGVPSAQSGNCFIDAIPFTLSHSGLRGSLSTKWSVAYPDDPEKGRMLPMDQELTWEVWQALGFDPHAPLTQATATRP